MYRPLWLQRFMLQVIILSDSVGRETPLNSVRLWHIEDGALFIFMLPLCFDTLFELVLCYAKL